MKIYLGSDHAGYELKEKIKTFLIGLEHKVEDFGAFEFEGNDDYPDFITPVANSVSSDKESIGIVFGGSGQGEAMCANRIKGVRAGVYYEVNIDSVRLLREHNDANIISIGSRFINEDEAKDAIKIFIDTKFSGEERHIRRLSKF